MKELSKVLEIFAYFFLCVTFFVLNILNKTITIHASIWTIALFTLCLITNVIYYFKCRKRRNLSKIFSIISAIFFSIAILNLKNIEAIALIIALGSASLTLLISSIILLTSKEKVEKSEEERKKINSSFKIILILFALFIIAFLFNIDLLSVGACILLILYSIYLKIKYPEEDKLNGLSKLIISLILLGFVFFMVALKFFIEVIKVIFEVFIEAIRCI